MKILIHSFILMLVSPPGKIAGAATLEGLEIPHGQQQSQIILKAQHRDGTKRVRRCSHPTWALDGVWAVFGWVQPAGHVPLQYLWEISGHMAEADQLVSFNLEKLLDIQDFKNFATAHFVAKCGTLNFRKVPFLPLSHGIVPFQSLSKILDHR